MRKRSVSLAALGLLTCAAMAHARPHAKTVAYDAKDKRCYSVAWARVRDKGGDPLVVVRKSFLPRTARESRAMQGRKI